MECYYCNDKKKIGGNDCPVCTIDWSKEDIPEPVRFTGLKSCGEDYNFFRIEQISDSIKSQILWYYRLAYYFRKTNPDLLFFTNDSDDIYDPNNFFYSIFYEELKI